MVAPQKSMEVQLVLKPKTRRALALSLAESSYTHYEKESRTSEQHTGALLDRAEKFLEFLNKEDTE